jgi:ATP-dependent helicase/nuclease subunit B
MAEHQQVWAEIVKLFDEMVGLLGDEPVDANSFTDILEAGLEQFDLALTPPTVDELLVGQVDRTRTPEIKATLVLGVNDGCFPRVPREGSVLSDADRHFLSRHQLDVLPATARRLLDEDLLAYYAFTRPSQLLYVSYSRSDAAGRSLAPSKYFERLAKMFPEAVRTTVPREPSADAQWIGTPRKLIAALTNWVRTGSAEADPASPWPALYQWLATQPGDPRFAAWRSLAYSNDSVLSPDVAARLFHSPLHTTAAELESFAACPFQHFLDYGLGLEKRDDEQDVSAGDLGNVYHQVLERVVGHLLKRRQSWIDLTDEERDRLIHSAAEQVGQKLRGEILLSNARNRYLLHRIERTLGQVVQTHKTGAARGRLKPAHARLRFGEGGDLPELTIPTPGGASVHLSGKIDRVDLQQDGDQAAVIDYRLGKHELSLDEVYHGLSLQLLTHLLVLESHGQALTGRKLTPAAAFYVQMMRRLDDVSHPSEALALDDPALHLRAKPRGLLAEGMVRVIDVDFKEGTSEVIHCSIKKDGAFGAKSRSDLASADEFSALMNHVRARIGLIADGILGGEIGIRPYLHGQTSPCPQCLYRPVCRFESAEGYRILPSIKREEVLNRVLLDRKEDERGK